MSTPFIFIHLGSDFFPDYVNTAIQQCKYWNPDSKLYFVSSNVHKGKILDTSVEHVFLENVPISSKRQQFLQTTQLDSHFRGGFWKYATERLFVLEDVCTQFNISEFFHLENDNMVYFHANEMIDIFRKHSNGLMAPTMNRGKIILGILYCNKFHVFQELTNFILTTTTEHEMEMASRFFNANIDKTSYLPSIPIEKIDNRFFSCGLSEFKGIFDPAQYGQWLGGIDPRNGYSAPCVYSNPETIVQANTFTYAVKKDRRYWITYEGHDYPIYVLHIHSKNLKQFYSLNLTM